MVNCHVRSVLRIIATMVKLRRMDIHLFHRTTENTMSIIEATMMIGCLRHASMGILLRLTTMDINLLLIVMGTPLLLQRLLEGHRPFIAARTPRLRRIA
jgi:hypothetical protein